MTISLNFLLDRSGSMDSMASDVPGAINSYLAEQRKVEGKAHFCLAQFDGQSRDYLRRYDDLKAITDLAPGEFSPRGNTPLYDSVAWIVAETDRQIADRARSNKKPYAQIHVIVLTDGQENASTEHTRQTIFALIKDREAKGWSFTYLGANQDSYAEGAKFGTQHANTMNYAGTGAGLRSAMASVSSAHTHHRTSGVEGSVSDFYFDATGKGAEESLEEDGGDPAAAKTKPSTAKITSRPTL